MLLKSQLKYIQSLGQKKFRDAENSFVAEGPKIVKELLNGSKANLVTLFAVKDWINLNKDLILELGNEKVVEIEDYQLERLSSLASPNQVMGVFQKPAIKAISPDQKISLVLDNIQDPGNLGTIIRIADWFGLAQIVCSEGSADAFNPKTIQSSMGSIARVQVVYEDLSVFLREHPRISTFATVLGGSNLFEVEPMPEAMILIGNESQGLNPDLINACGHRISIPKKGQAESLNAAVATGIILSHLIK